MCGIVHYMSNYHQLIWPEKIGGMVCSFDWCPDVWHRRILYWQVYVWAFSKQCWSATASG